MSGAPAPSSGRERPGGELSRQLAAEYTAGATIKQLRHRHGLPYSAVRDHVIAGGATMRPRSKPKRFTAPKTLAGEYTAGATIRELAAKHGTSFGTMHRRLLADPDVTFRAPGRHPAAVTSIPRRSAPPSTVGRHVDETGTAPSTARRSSPKGTS